MPIDLSSYKKIGTALLFRMTTFQYRQEVDGPDLGTYIFRLSDSLYDIDIIYNGSTESYQSVGQLMNITGNQSELRPSTGNITVTLSGIPDAKLKEIIASKIKGSYVQIFRVILDENGDPLDIEGNPLGRFFGLVTNYTLDETYDLGTGQATNTIGLVCANWLEVLGKKKTGRKTNPEDMDAYYTGDNSFDRVPSLVNANFNFGEPK